MSKYPNDFWPAWSENAINTIDWMKPGGADLKGKPSKTVTKAPVPEVPAEPSKFFDDEVSILPKQFLCDVYTWKRPDEIPVERRDRSISSMRSTSVLNSSINVAVLSDENYDLISLNSHLKSSYYDHIMDSVHILRNYSFWQPEDFDGFGFEKWNPLNYIYSGEPVKFGEPHEVPLNEAGKYAVRLFHCGDWRTIVVDDRIPVTKANKILLPIVRKSTQLDIWPLLLTKAILKLNFCRTIDEEFYLDQSHTSECRMYDEERCFCKTFIPNNVEYLHDERDLQRLNVIYLLTGSHLLEIDYSNRYLSDVWTDVKRYLDHYHIGPSRENSRRASRKSGKSIDLFEIKFMPLVVFDLLLPEVDPLKQKRKYAEILCTKYRDTPLYKEVEQEELPNWKTFRWIYWAMEKNIWQPVDVTTFWSILCKYNTSEKVYYTSLLEEEWNKIVNPQEAVADGTVKRITAKKSKDELRRRSSIKNKTTEDWFSFRKVLSQIQGLKILTRRVSFDSEYILSDEVEPPPPPPPPVDPKALKAKASKEKEIPPPPEPTQKKVKLMVDQNSEYYIFLDLAKKNKILVDLNVVKLCPEQTDSIVDFELFQWNCHKHKSVCYLNTNCFTSCKIDYPKGRSVFKINMNANKFCLRVSAEDQVKIVTFYELLDALNTDGLRMTTYFEEVKNEFLLAVQFIGKEEFIEHMQLAYKSLLNFCKENYKKEGVFRKFLYEKFIKHLFQYLREINDAERILPMRRFFFLHILKQPGDVARRDPDWRELLKKYNEIKDELCDCPNQENPYFSNEEMERIYKNAAITIQAAFKSYYIRLFMQPHFDSTNILFNESVISWYNKYFIESPRMMYEILYRLFFTCLQDFEDIILAEEYGRNSLILNFYQFFEDYRNSLRVLTFPAQTNLCYQWTFLKICYLVPHAESTNMKFILYAFSSLYKEILFSLKVFRADDLTEVPYSEAPYLWTLSNKVAGGYKLFIYMYSSQPLQDFNWMFKVGFLRHIGFPVLPNPENMPDHFFVEDVLKAKICNWEDWVICPLDGLIYRSDVGSAICDCEIYVVEKAAIVFVLFEYFGEGIELTLKITKYENVRPFMTLNMSHHDHFYKIIPQGTYKLQIFFTQVGEVRPAEMDDDMGSEEDATKLIGNWYIKIGHEQCVDVEVTDIREEKISI